MTATRAGLTALLLLLAPAVSAQEDEAGAAVKVLKSVERWRGQLHILRHHTNDFGDGVYSERGHDTHTASATFIVEYDPGKEQWVSREILVTGSLSTGSRSGKPGEWRTSETRASYSSSARDGDISFDVGRDKKGACWQLSNNGRLSRKYVEYHRGTAPKEPDWSSERESDYWAHTAIRVPVAGPLKHPGPLSHTDERPSTSPETEKHRRTSMIRTRVLLVPDLADVEVVVDIESYDAWMPRGTADGKLPGSELTAFATLKPKPGRTLSVKPSKFRFELQDTSREPGVCMNWPRLAATAAATPREDAAFDLRFNAEDGKLANADAQQIEVDRIENKDDGTYTARATIQAWDFGGIGNLLVSAELDDGRTAFGALKGSGEMLIPLPKRRPGSRIAEAYRKKWKCDDPDEADVDAEPVGDGNKGDGFSAYEEYRGFFRAGKHVRTWASTKDLFVVNTLGDPAVEGLARFELGTGLHVHEETLPEELTEDRVANPNRSASSPRSSQEFQHGLRVGLRAGRDKSEVEMRSGAWRPKNADRVAISAALIADASSDDGADRLARTIAHELGHACGVRHHGDKDRGWVAFVRHQAAGGAVVLEVRASMNPSTGTFEVKDGTSGRQVRILSESGTEVPPDSAFFDDPRFAFVGVQGGQHSGHSGCFMRYIAAGWYVPEGSPRDRVFWEGGHPVGRELCEAPDADGAWKKRFGRASVGDCKHRFAVRDDAPEK